MLRWAPQEALGKYVDVHALFQVFVNSRFGRPMEYSAYLEEMPQTHKIPRNLKFTK